jgi:hypothetical protein
MSTSLSTLSPSALAALTRIQPNKPSTMLDIRWQPTLDAPPTSSVLLYPRFPKAVATTFSGKWRAQFQPVVALASLEQLRQMSNTTVTVVGGDPEAFKAILQWMLSCCDGKGIEEFPKGRGFREKPFVRLVWLR